MKYCVRARKGHGKWEDCQKEISRGEEESYVQFSFLGLTCTRGLVIHVAIVGRGGAQKVAEGKLSLAQVEVLA